MIQIEQTGKNGIVIFDETGSRTVTNFHPYFYVEDLEGKHISLFGEKCKKIIVDSPMDVVREREKYGKTFESDIQFRERYCIDNISIPIPKSELHIVFLDIETDMSLDTENAPKPITCITIYSSKLQKYITFVWRQDLEKRKVGETYYFNNEKEMMLNFVKCISDIKPHLLSGWNVGFDLKYIINRSKNIGININKISPMNNVNISKYGDVRIYGCVVFDLLQAYKKLHQNLMDSYSLKSIAQKELQEEKIVVELENVWQQNIDKLIEYNKKDVELCKKINDKIGIINFFDELRREVGCLWESLWQSSYLIDVIILREAKKRTIVLPSKKKKEDTKDFEGGFVLEPKVGLWKNVIVLDIQSMYPNIIITGNLSPETLSNDGDIWLNNYRFKKEKGFIPTIINDLFQLRTKYKKLYKETGDKSYYNKQWSVKIILNAIYGVLAFNGFRLYEPRLASTVTWLGRIIINRSKDIVEKNGYIVVGSDTDSVMIKLPDEYDFNKCLETGKELRIKLNESYDKLMNEFGIEEHTLNMQFEKCFKTFLILAKKNYAGWLVWKE